MNDCRVAVGASYVERLIDRNASLEVRLDSASIVLREEEVGLAPCGDVKALNALCGGFTINSVSHFCSPFGSRRFLYTLSHIRQEILRTSFVVFWGFCKFFSKTTEHKTKNAPGNSACAKWNIKIKDTPLTGGGVSKRLY